MKTLQYHPAAERFPLMEDLDLDILAKDITGNGLLSLAGSSFLRASRQIALSGYRLGQR
jgi:hypothetical protein